MCCNTISRRLLFTLAALGLLAGLGTFVASHAIAAAKDAPAEDADAAVTSPLEFTVTTIEGEEVDLGIYYGDVVLVVNTASKCGLTKQYKQLQALHEQYDKVGLSILGFPANNFGKQEPGTNEDISKFCQKNYGVEFDMFAKVSVKGDDITPLYAYLTSVKTKPKEAGVISWNFEKFLIGRDGTVVARFAPRTKPDAKEVLKAIEAELAKPMPADAKAKREAAAKSE